MIVLRNTDGWIRQRVVEELRRDVRLQDTEIDVEVHDGFVTIAGFVFDWHKRIAAQETALRVEGVQEVANQIYVELGRVG